MNYNYLTAFTLFIDVTQTFRHGYVAGFFLLDAKYLMLLMEYVNANKSSSGFLN